MKNRKALCATFAILALGILLQPPPVLAQAGRSDNLKEALSRLEKTLIRHGSKSIGGVIRRFDARDFRGCKISYELTPLVATDHKGFVPFTERTTIDLSFLDQQSVIVREGSKGTATVSFVTLRGEPKIEHRLGNEPHLFGEAKLMRSHYFSIMNKAAAEEVRGALLRAIELCKQ